MKSYQKQNGNTKTDREADDRPMWEKFPSLWKTQAAYMNWVRGGIRRGLWNKSPVKLEFLKLRTYLIDNTNPRSMKRFPKVKACKCDICDGVFKSSEVEVDHIKGNHSLKSMDDVKSFIENIIEVDFDMLQIACLSCHKTKSHAEKNGVSFEEAKVEKEAIAIMNSKKDKETLIGWGITPASNQKKRREQIVQYLMNKEKE